MAETINLGFESSTIQSNKLNEEDFQGYSGIFSLHDSLGDFSYFHIFFITFQLQSQAFVVFILK